MRILYVTTIGGTMSFFRQFIKGLIEQGHTVDIACNDTDTKVPELYYELGCKVHTIQTSRSPLSKGNLVAIKQIRQLVEKNKYDIVHCHTPVAAMCTRIACRKARKSGTRVFYTAHGFHFYKGAPLKNWLLFYPVEKVCAHFTDVLITINKEDYALAQKKMKAKRIEYVPGVGIDLSKFEQIIVDKAAKREELGIPKDAVLLLSVGELNENKNHETVIRTVSQLDGVYYIIAGEGELHEHLQSVVDGLGMTDRVKLLGYRNDVAQLHQAVDIYVLPSIREGLNVSVMEAMASGLPCIVSKIRGNTDLVDTNGGMLFDPHSTENCTAAIKQLLSSDLAAMGKYNQKKVEGFSSHKVHAAVRNIYGVEANG